MKYFIPKVYNCIKTGFKSSLASISALRSAFYTTFLTVYITCLKSILSFKIAKIIHVSYSITALKPDVDKFCFAYLSLHIDNITILTHSLMLCSQMKLPPYYFVDLQITGEFTIRPGTGHLSLGGHKSCGRRPASVYNICRCVLRVHPLRSRSSFAIMPLKKQVVKKETKPNSDSDGGKNLHTHARLQQLQ